MGKKRVMLFTILVTLFFVAVVAASVVFYRFSNQVSDELMDMKQTNPGSVESLVNSAVGLNAVQISYYQ